MLTKFETEILPLLNQLLIDWVNEPLDSLYNVKGLCYFAACKYDKNTFVKLFEFIHSITGGYFLFGMKVSCYPNKCEGITYRALWITEQIRLLKIKENEAAPQN